jgi:hypothetical protein
MSDPSLSANDFLRGLLAALAATGNRNVVGSQYDVHRAFYNVIQTAQKDPAIPIEVRDIEYDPLYGLSGWLDRALTNAQRDLIIRFPNPTYERLEISFDPNEGHQVLESLGSKDKFLSLANQFADELRKDVTRP